MRYFRDDVFKYPDRKAEWRLNDDGTVDFRGEFTTEWRRAIVLDTEDRLYDAIFAGDLVEIPASRVNPTEYLCDDY